MFLTQLLRILFCFLPSLTAFAVSSKPIQWDFTSIVLPDQAVRFERIQDKAGRTIFIADLNKSPQQLNGKYRQERYKVSAQRIGADFCKSLGNGLLDYRLQNDATTFEEWHMAEDDEFLEFVRDETAIKAVKKLVYKFDVKPIPEGSKIIVLTSVICRFSENTQ